PTRTATASSSTSARMAPPVEQSGSHQRAPSSREHSKLEAGRSIGGAMIGRDVEVVPEVGVGRCAVGGGAAGKLEGDAQRRRQQVFLAVVMLGAAPAVAGCQQIEPLESLLGGVEDQVAKQPAVVATSLAIPLLPEGADG